MNNLAQFWHQFSTILSRELIKLEGIADLRILKLGKTQIDLMTIIYLTLFSLLLVRGTAFLQEILSERILSKTKLDSGARQAIASSIHYGLLFIGLVVLLQTAGIELSALTVLLGAVGIGVSLGMQGIINNVFSGLVILFERPIKTGDRVQIGDVVGNVVSISLRATTVISNEGVAIVVPNSQFVTSNVINWTHWGRTVGLRIPVTVPKSSDPDRVKQSMMDAAASHSGVMHEPPPVVLFDELSNDVIRLSLRVWTKDFSATSEALRSDLLFDICKRLRDLSSGVTPVAPAPNSVAAISSAPATVQSCSPGQK